MNRKAQKMTCVKTHVFFAHVKLCVWIYAMFKNANANAIKGNLPNANSSHRRLSNTWITKVPCNMKWIKVGLLGVCMVVT